MVLNVGTGLGTSILDLANAISRGEKQIEHREARFGDIPSSIADTKHIKEILGWQPVVRIEHGIEMMRTYYAKYGLMAQVNTGLAEV